MSSPSVAASWSGRLRAAVDRLASAIGRSDRYLRWRAGVVGAWAVAAAATLVLTCPGDGHANALGAEVQVLGESLVGAQVLVRNDSADVWTDLELTLDGEWRYRHPTLRPRDQVVVATTQFRRGADTLPADHRPRRLEVRCAQGSHAFDVR
jgi:hypothetical protein